MSSEKLNDQYVEILRPKGYMEHHQVERVYWDGEYGGGTDHQ